MDPQIIDYYNETPSCFKTIEKFTRKKWRNCPA